MSITRWKREATVFAIAFAFAMGVTQSAQSFPSIRTAWKVQYPASTTDDNVLSGTGAECQICHESSGGGNGWNAYGWEIRLGIVGGGLSTTDAIVAAQTFNSDLDPAAANNLTEINGGTQPGWTPGANNTIYFKNGSTLAFQSPPTISGDLDPPAPQVPLAGPWAHALLIMTIVVLGLAGLRLSKRARSGPVGA